MATLNSSTPRTWTSSETVTAAQLNEELSSNFNATVAYLGTDYKTDTTSSSFIMGLPLTLNSTNHKHVRIVGRVRTESGVATNLRMQFSGIASTVYAYSRLLGTGGTSTGDMAVSTTSAFVATPNASGVSSNAFGTFDITITNPHSTNWKSWVSEGMYQTSTSSTGVITFMVGGVCASTISTSTFVTLFFGSGDKFSSGSYANLYWIP